MGKLISALNLTEIEFCKNWKSIGIFGNDSQVKNGLIKDIRQSNETKMLDFGNPGALPHAIELAATGIISVVFIDLHCCPELLDDGKFSDAVSRLCALGRKYGIKVIGTGFLKGD